MAIKDALLPEFDHEMGVTRRLLERVPLADRDWKPHAKSMTLGELARHVSDIPGWVGGIVDKDAFDVEATGPMKTDFTSTTELLKSFDAGVVKARASLDSKSDAEMMATWSIKKGSKELMTLPKVGVFRTLLLNHLIHHRGQLSVYIRLKDIPVPSIYGPSADEAVF